MSKVIWVWLLVGCALGAAVHAGANPVGATAPASLAAPAAQGFVLDTVLAVVGSKPITQSMVTQMKRLAEEQNMPIRSQPAPGETMADAILRDLVYQQLLINAAEKDGYQVPDTAIDEMVKKFMDGEAARHPTQKDYDAALARNRETRESRAQQMRVFFRNQWLSEAMRSELFRKMNAPGGTTAAAPAAEPLDENQIMRVSQLLFRVAADAPGEQVAAAQARAEQFVLRARSGEAFTSLQREVAETVPDAPEPGSIMEITPKEPFPEFAPAFALEAGAVSDPIRTRIGVHVLKVIAKSEVQDRAQMQQFERFMNEWLAKQAAEQQVRTLGNPK